MTRVLVTGAGAVLGQGIIKSLLSAQANYEIIAADPSPLSPGLYWANSSALLPMANSPDYAVAVERLMAQYRPDVVLVGTDVELGVFAEHRHRWETDFSTRIVVSDPGVIEIADDKYATACFLESHGLDHPMSVLPENNDDLQNLISTVGFPLVVKPRRGARAVGVSLVHDKAELMQALKGRRDLVVQQLAGPAEEEYTAGVLFFEDEVKASIVLRRDLRDGNTHRAYVGEYPQCEQYVRSVAKALKPYGPANFQFRKDKEGRCRLFEINARFSGTTPMRALTGFNEVDMVIRHLSGGEPIVQPAVKQGVILRFLQEQFVETSAVLTGCDP